MSTRERLALRPLEEVATIEREGITANAITRGTLYVGLEHIDSDGAFVSVKGVDAGELASNKFRFSPNHILFGKLRPYLRKTARPDFEGICSTDILPILPGPKLDRDYLFHYLRHPKVVEQAVRRCTGANLPRLSPRDLAAFEVPVPSRAEQRRIADILDKADAIRRKRKEAIALTGELLRSAFLEMFGDLATNPKGWPVKFIGEIADVGGGLQVTSARSENPIPLPYLRVANVYRDRLDLREVKEIHVTPAERDRALLRAGDVLVVEGHGNAAELGRAAVWNGEIPDCTHQNHLIRVRVNTELLSPAFLSSFLNSSSGRAQMLKLGKTTSGLNTISTNNVRSVNTIVPPRGLQERFEKVVRRARDLITRMQQPRHDEDLFHSLVAWAFSGTRTSAEASC